MQEVKSSTDGGAWCIKHEISLAIPWGLPDPLGEQRFVRDWLAGESAAREFYPRLRWEELAGSAVDSPPDKSSATPARASDVGDEAVVTSTDRGPDGTAPHQCLSPELLSLFRNSRQGLDEEAIREIREFNLSVGNWAGAELAEWLGNPATRAVVTGQQPYLLLAPLYNLWKAVGAAVLAEKLTALTGQRVVPIFWVASDDHDFAELRDSYIVDRDGQLRNLGVLLPRGGKIPIGSPAYEWHLEDVAPSLVAAFEHQLPEGPARRLTAETVAASLQPPATLETVFCRLLATYLASLPMIFVTPHMRFLRRGQIPLLRQEIERGGELNQLVNERGRAMAAAKYQPPLRRRSSDVNFFYILDRVRARVVRRGKNFSLLHPETGARITEIAVRDLLDHLERHPENFSPNVVLRPIVQDFVLPTVAYVAGPTEFTYLVQLADVYRALGVAQSLPVLRPCGIIVSEFAQNVFRSLGVDHALRQNGLQGIIETLVGQDPTIGRVLTELRGLENQLQTSLCSLDASASARYPHLAVGFEKTRRSIVQAFERLRERIFNQMGHDWARKCRKLCHALTELAPAGQPQERILGPLSFGYEITPTDLVAAMADAVRPNWPREWLMLVELASTTRGGVGAGMFATPSAVVRDV